MIGSALGQLVVTRQIGEGGMGAVFMAEHRVLKTKHVVKVLLPQWTQNATIVQRFVNEARAAAAIRHRNIIQVQDCAQLPHGQWYIVMEYLDGRTLAQFASAQQAPLSPHLIIQVMSQVANGLEAAHARNIIHRDLKPENIFLTSRDGNPHHVTILDFGIAKLGEAEGGASTRTGQMAGTPAYMAPEQMRDLKSVDPRTDVYALGVITYQLVTGGWLPYQEGGSPGTYYELSAAEIYHRQLTQPPTDPRRRVPTISDGWSNAIMTSLHPDPARRPQSARQFATMLAEATPGDRFVPSGVELVQQFARELLDIGNMLETVRAPVRKDASSQSTSRYQFGQRLGQGGMAEVFRGTMVGAEGFAREVAIKRVLPGFSNVPQFASMFIDEARLASQLVHPNIVQVLDFDRDTEGRHFLVMEYVDGKDLAALRDTGPLSPSMINFIMTETLRGLGYAHNLPVPKQGIRGLVHRDVSPHNVLLSWEGAVKVSDFGIAKAREATSATASTMIKGKPGYMSPEQANGEELDGRSDLFAVGIMMWELLTGQPLFVGTTQEAIAQIFFRPIPKPSTLRAGVPPDLEAVTLRLLEREKNARYATAEQVINDLALCRDLPRDGRGELIRLLAERFPGAIIERASGRIHANPVLSSSKPTALARPTPANAEGGAGWGSHPTTLGSAAAQSVARHSRARLPYVIGGIAIAAAALVGIVFAQMESSRDSPPEKTSTQTAPAVPSPAIDAASSLQVTINSVPAGAQIVVDGSARGAAPVTLRLAPGTRFQIIASKDGFVDATLTAIAERDGQLVSLALAAKPAVPTEGSATESKPAAKPVKARPAAKPKPSETAKPAFDPNEVGGD